MKNSMVMKIMQIHMEKPTQIYDVYILVPQQNMIHPVIVIQRQLNNMNQLMDKCYL